MKKSLFAAIAATVVLGVSVAGQEAPPNAPKFIKFAKAPGLEVRYLDFKWDEEAFRALEKGGSHPAAQRSRVLARLLLQQDPLFWNGQITSGRTHDPRCSIRAKAPRAATLEMRYIDMREVFVDMNVIAEPPPGRDLSQGARRVPDRAGRRLPPGGLARGEGPGVRAPDSLRQSTGRTHAHPLVGWTRLPHHGDEREGEATAYSLTVATEENGMKGNAEKDDQVEKVEEGKAPLKAKKYMKELRRLQAELCQLQAWVKHRAAYHCDLRRPRCRGKRRCDQGHHRARKSARFPGRRPARALGPREDADLYAALHAYFPAAGEIVIFDRSWYNRAGVEYVMGFCTKEQHERFLQVCPC